MLYDEDLVLDDDGNFEIVVSPERPDDAKNWMKNAPGAESLLVRFTHSDWETERIDPLYIERLDTDGEPPVPLTAASMVAGLKTHLAIDVRSNRKLDRDRRSHVVVGA